MGAYLAVKLRIIFCMHTRNNETHTQRMFPEKMGQFLPNQQQ